MTNKEFNLLSRFITKGSNVFGNKKDTFVIEVEDVKEFIRLLKEELADKFSNFENIMPMVFNPMIDKLAGEKLR